MKINRFLIIFFFLILGCKNVGSEGRSFDDCPNPVPVAVFSDTLSAVTSHQFHLKATEGIEEVAFKNGMQLTLIQSGCEAIRQEFQFRLPGDDFPDDTITYWIEETMNQLRFLANLGPQYLSLNAWTQVIEEQKEQIQLGEPVEIQIGFFVEIDRIISADHAILLLILSERP